MARLSLWPSTASLFFLLTLTLALCTLGHGSSPCKRLSKQALSQAKAGDLDESLSTFQRARRQCESPRDLAKLSTNHGVVLMRKAALRLEDSSSGVVGQGTARELLQASIAKFEEALRHRPSHLSAETNLAEAREQLAQVVAKAAPSSSSSSSGANHQGRCANPGPDGTCLSPDAAGGGGDDSANDDDDDDDDGDNSDLAAAAAAQAELAKAASRLSADLVSVRGASRSPAEAQADLEAFRSWFTDNTLGLTLEAEAVALEWSEDDGFTIKAGRDIAAGEFVIAVPGPMVHQRGHRSRADAPNPLGEEQKRFLARAAELTQRQTSVDMSEAMLLWQDLVDAQYQAAHARRKQQRQQHQAGDSDSAAAAAANRAADRAPTATGNPPSGMGPWLRTYGLSAMYPRLWTAEENQWVSGQPWARSFAGQLMGGRARVDWVNNNIVPTLRREFPSQLPPEHFTAQGFEWAHQLLSSRDISGGFMVAAHDIMNHDLARFANVQFQLVPDPEHPGYTAYRAVAKRAIRAGEVLTDTYNDPWNNPSAFGTFDFVHDKGVDPGGTHVAVDAEVIATAAAAVAGKNYQELLPVLQGIERPASHVYRQENARLRNATSLADLADDFAVVLMQAALARDPAAAAQKAEARNYQPPPAYRRNGGLASPKKAGMRALLRECARKTLRDVRQWSRERKPAPSTPPHRVAAVRRIAEEAVMVAEKALVLLEV